MPPNWPQYCSVPAPMCTASKAHHRPSSISESTTSPLPMRYPARALGSRYGAPVIDSMPPATTTSASPAWIIWSARYNAFDARQAHLVDGDRRHAHRDAGLDRGLAGGDLALPGLEHLAHDHVVDLVGADTGALERALDRDTAEILRAERGEARPRACRSACERSRRSRNRAWRLPERRNAGGLPAGRGRIVAVVGAATSRRAVGHRVRTDRWAGACDHAACTATVAGHDDRDRRHPFRRPRGCARRRARLAAHPRSGPRCARPRRRAGDVRRAWRRRRRTRARSTHVDEFPFPEIAPDEAVIAVDGVVDQLQHRLDLDLRTAPDLRVPQAPRQGERVGRPPRPTVPRDGQ